MIDLIYTLGWPWRSGWSWAVLTLKTPQPCRILMCPHIVLSPPATHGASAQVLMNWEGLYQEAYPT